MQDSYELSVLKRKQLYDLTFKNENNEKGLIYKLTSVLFVHGWNIIQATAKTNFDGIVEDSFLIEPIDQTSFTDETLQNINKDLTQLLKGDVSVLEYLTQYPQVSKKLESFHNIRNVAKIDISQTNDPSLTILTIQSSDRPGLLFEISQVLYLLNFDIESFKASYNEDGIFDTLYLRKENGTNPISNNEKKQLENLLMELFTCS